VSPEEAYCAEPQRTMTQSGSRPWTPGRNLKTQANAARGRLNHVNAAEAEETPDVMLGTFLVNSIPARVMFDSGASHSFVTEHFVKKGKLESTMMARAMLVQIPRSVVKTKEIA
jgi:hypothetical protein